MSGGLRFEVSCDGRVVSGVQNSSKPGALRQSWKGHWLKVSRLK